MKRCFTPPPKRYKLTNSYPKSLKYTCFRILNLSHVVNCCSTVVCTSIRLGQQPQQDWQDDCTLRNMNIHTNYGEIVHCKQLSLGRDITDRSLQFFSFSQKDTWMIKKHTRRCSLSLIREAQRRPVRHALFHLQGTVTSLRHKCFLHSHLAPPLSKAPGNNSVGNTWRNQNPHPTAGGDVKWYSHLEGSQKIKQN